MAPDPSPTTAELGYAGVGELRSRLSTGELTSSELVGTLLRRIQAIDAPGSSTGLRSVLPVSDRALDEARESDNRQAED
jgi:Asp-tRNA(Asn)/Glu-tRNA(Gln) amidotransferase A subunit family amidase